MRHPFAWSLTAAAAVMLSLAASHPIAAQNGVALTGQVTSEKEGAMEGVVVSAKKAGSIVKVSVITDAQGRYSFPEDRLEPGDYTITIRAVGYDIGTPTKATVATEKTSTADIRLKPTRNLASQLTNAEWMMSVPGAEDQKALLLNCTSCHTLERIVRSTHDADEWTHVVTRMMGYGAVSQPIKPQRMLDTERAGTPEQYRKFAEYLATINLSAVDKWQYPLKTLPRPQGRATHVIITEYDVGRPTTEPHDVVLDKEGNVWYSDFGEMFISKFDPKTLKLTEYPVKKYKPNAPEGQLSLEFDTQGKLWFDTMYQGSLGTIDPKTGETKFYPLPAKWNDNRVQLNFVGLRHDVDGKVWTKSVGTQDIFRLDIASGEWDKFHPTDKLSGGRHSIYQVISDSKNNLWMAEFVDGYIGKIDAKTGAVTWYDLPTAHGRARRMQIDDQDRILLTEYRGNAVAVFDTRAEKFVNEYKLPTQYSGPYRAAIDKNGEVWVAGMQTDRAIRLDPRTGQTVEYLMPSDTNMRSLVMDNSTSPVTFWTGSNHAHALVKVEPLD
ncbi:MAG TPA: carboxypeptidase regulatory-like domain-containing protein [Xanthobacteraceae bacterium]|nr:carboxypeptidase regulatory-like domain-containing protein [Xanthobacteraceae bacterium]